LFRQAVKIETLFHRPTLILSSSSFVKALFPTTQEELRFGSITLREQRFQSIVFIGKKYEDIMIHILIELIPGSMKKIIQNGGVSIAFSESFQIHLADFERIRRLIAVFEKDTNARQLIKIHGFASVLGATPESKHMIRQVNAAPVDQVTLAQRTLDRYRRSVNRSSELLDVFQ
jgi:hypothetical protein